jgi:hypothetical protein
MTSERAHGTVPTRPAAAPWFRALAKLASGAVLVGFACLAISGSLACAEEELECCECFFPQCLDSMGSGSPQRVCSCEGPYTYEQCGLFCKDTAPVDLFAQGFTNCGVASSTLAKDSCSIGSPVGPE